MFGSEIAEYRVSRSILMGNGRLISRDMSGIRKLQRDLEGRRLNGYAHNVSFEADMEGYRKDDMYRM